MVEFAPGLCGGDTLPGFGFGVPEKKKMKMFGYEAAAGSV